MTSFRTEIVVRTAILVRTAIEAPSGPD